MSIPTTTSNTSLPNRHHQQDFSFASTSNARSTGQEPPITADLSVLRATRLHGIAHNSSGRVVLISRRPRSGSACLGRLRGVGRRSRADSPKLRRERRSTSHRRSRCRATPTRGEEAVRWGRQRAEGPTSLAGHFPPASWSSGHSPVADETPTWLPAGVGRAQQAIGLGFVHGTRRHPDRRRR